MPDLRRFYFDDGYSRKRWHVQMKGKAQVVQYGRLGGSLRESKKSFKTPAEAAEKTEKLIASKSRDGYSEINPSRLEIVQLKGKRKATEQQVKALEKQIGCSLPGEYRNFLKTINGGRPNPDCVQVPGVEGIDNVVGVGSLFHLQPSQPGVDELSHEFERAGELLPEGHLPIAGSSDVFTLSLKPKTFGSVYWWFHETEELDDDGNFLESAGYLLAGSFDEFLTRIALLFGDDEEFEVETTSQSGATAKKPKATIKRLLRLVNHDLTPKKVKEIEQVVKELGDLGGIQDGEWPFNNIDSPRVVRCLLKAGLNPEITDTEKHSLLWQCATHPECVKLLLEHGADIDRHSGSHGETALMRAISLENIPAVKRLLQLGADPTVRLSKPSKNTLQYNEKLRKLIEKARVEWPKNKKKKTTSQQATAKPKTASPEKKKKGPKPTINRLLRLMKHDHITDYEDFGEIIELITDLGDLSGIPDGKWPIIDKFENPHLLRCLLEAGLNPEITDKGGNSLLSRCVMHPECIDLLLERGVAVDRRSGRNHDETALMRATWIGDEECVQRLLDAGANPTLEFDSFAKVMLNMDEEMAAVLESARDDWRRNKRKKKKKATAKKKKK